jgi:hypothetical protein
MRKYLHLAQFDVENYKSMCYRLPVENKKWFDPTPDWDEKASHDRLWS